MQQIKGFVMAGGCNAHGVSGSAGIGRHVVESMFEKEPSEYVQSLSPDRYVVSRCKKTKKAQRSSRFDKAWDWSTAEKDARHIYETYYHIRKS